MILQHRQTPILLVFYYITEAVLWWLIFVILEIMTYINSCMMQDLFSGWNTACVFRYRNFCVQYICIHTHARARARAHTHTHTHTRYLLHFYMLMKPDNYCWYSTTYKGLSTDFSFLSYRGWDVSRFCTSISVANI